MIQKIREMQIALEIAQKDMSNFIDKGNDAAGQRVRSTLLDISKATKDVRKQIQQLRESKKENRG
tara:strand:- start:398 stop:592 length:195 start_codon:yes stop_codon:yes gene_type:complete